MRRTAKMLVPTAADDLALRPNREAVTEATRHVIEELKLRAKGNIDRFGKLLETEIDVSKRQTLLSLLAEEETILAAFEKEVPLRDLKSASTR